jgi:hypothetical protein
MFKLGILFFTIAFWVFPQISFATFSLDSLKVMHDKLYQDYQHDRSTMEERTWIRLVELDRKANELIKTGQLIMERFSELMSQEKNEFLETIDLISLEKALLERELEIQEMGLNRRITYQQTLVLSTVVVGILFIISLILLFSIKSRYKSARGELERFYSSHDVPNFREMQPYGKRLTNNKLNVMKENNEQLKKELNRISNEKSETLEALKKEIRDRKKMEQEIKNLIEQIKKQ